MFQLKRLRQQENGVIEALNINTDPTSVRRYHVINSKVVNDADKGEDNSGELHLRHLMLHFPKPIKMQAIIIFAEPMTERYAYVYTSDLKPVHKKSILKLMLFFSINT
jgi:hypothetical protein